MQRLAVGHDVSMTDFPRWFDGYLQTAPTLPLAQRQIDAAAFEQFYFRWNDDQPRRRALAAVLGR
jgi:hypothetical protein